MLAVIRFSDQFADAEHGCKSAVTANEEQKAALQELATSRDRGEADRAGAVLLTLAGWTSLRIAEAFGVREHTVCLWRSADFIALLETLDGVYGPKPGVRMKPVVIVLDNGPIHVSKATATALAARAHWLTVERLPKYAPEFNDIEIAWHDLKVWAAIGERPIALSHHRYDWLYVTASWHPRMARPSGICPTASTRPFFAKLLEAFARVTAAGRDRIIVLQLDNAGWHTPHNLPVPDGIRFVYQPPRTPELQPVEHLWPLVDDPLANTHFDTIDDLDAAIADRCRNLHQDRSLISSHTKFHWWPIFVVPS